MTLPCTRGAPDSALPTIFQIYYKDEQLTHLDKDAVPFDNRGVQHPLLEFDVFERIARTPVSPETTWGAVSWKFSAKTGLTLRALTEFIQKHPGYDYYYCNPFPKNESLYHNMWQQGELCHPQFLSLTTEFFEAAGLDTRHLSTVQPSSAFSATNYHVGNARFWRSYLSFIRKAITTAEQALPPHKWENLISSKADIKGVHAGACYLPFIVERLFSYWMCYVARPEKLKGCKYPIATDYLDIHLQTLKLLKDKAVQDRSNLLAASWANYRTLYFTQTFGTTWARANLSKITPTVIHFDKNQPHTPTSW